MEVEYRENKTCFLCGSNEYDIIWSGGVRDACNENIDVYKCRCCGLVRLSKLISDANEFYSISGMREFKTTDCLKERQNTYRDDVRRANFLDNAIVNKKVLDFGCGAGGFLKLASYRTKDVYGIELEKNMRQFIVSDGLCCFSSIDECKKELNHKIDLITMFHVLEHLEQPIETLKALVDILNDDGKIILEIPNADDALLSLYHCEAFAAFTYWICHCYLYNSLTLNKLIDMAGLKINFIKHIQRYPLSNHLYWLSHGKPGGHEKWLMMNDELVDKLYGEKLSELGISDTILAEISRA